MTIKACHDAEQLEAALDQFCCWWDTEMTPYLQAKGYSDEDDIRFMVDQFDRVVLPQLK